MQWFRGLKAWQKVVIVVFLWPFLAAWWFFASPRFTKKTKGIAAGALGVLVLVSALAGSGQKKKEEVVAAGKVKSAQEQSAAISSSTTTSAPAPTTTTAPVPTTTAPVPTTTTTVDP